MLCAHQHGRWSPTGPQGRHLTFEPPAGTNVRQGESASGNGVAPLPFGSASQVADDFTPAPGAVPVAVLVPASLQVRKLLVTLVLTVIGLGICLPRRNNRGQLIILIVITALLTTALCVIRDVERPFGGIIDVQPTAITEAEPRATRDSC